MVDIIESKRKKHSWLSPIGPWMDCLVRCLEMDYVKGDGCGGGGGNQGDAVGSEGGDGILVVLCCLLSIASFWRARMQ